MKRMRDWIRLRWALRPRLFKYGFWFWLARRVPRPLRYHVYVMCTADYSTESDYVDEVPLILAMDVAKWHE